MKQLFTALITPFTAKDTIDFDALEHLLNRQIDADVDGVVILGTTGESELLSDKERQEIIKFTCEIVQKRIKIIVGCGKSSTKETLESIEKAFHHSINSVMVVTPAYVKPDMNGLYHHFKAISDQKMPFIMYHHPFRTGCNPPLLTLESILELPYSQGLKDASSSCEIARCFAQKYTLFSGDDNLLLPHLSLGASGIISVCSNLIPEVFKQVLNTFEKDPKKALKEFSKFTPLIDAIFKLPNPIGIKNALSQINLIQDFLRLPYTNADCASASLILEKIQASPKTIGLCPKDTSFSLI